GAGGGDELDAIGQAGFMQNHRDLAYEGRGERMKEAQGGTSDATKAEAAERGHVHLDPRPARAQPDRATKAALAVHRSFSLGVMPGPRHSVWQVVENVFMLGMLGRRAPALHVVRHRRHGAEAQGSPGNRRDDRRGHCVSSMMPPAGPARGSSTGYRTIGAYANTPARRVHSETDSLLLITLKIFEDIRCVDALNPLDRRT